MDDRIRVQAATWICVLCLQRHEVSKIGYAAQHTQVLFFAQSSIMNRVLSSIVVGVALVVTTGLAADRTLEEFVEYSKRRIVNVDAEVIDEFAKVVDRNGDGRISDDEFGGRIAAYQSVFQTAQPMRARSSHTLPEDWFTDFEKASVEANKSGRPMVVMFSASWCAPCKMMIAQVFPDEKVKATLKEVVPVYIDSEVNVELATENGIRAYPTFVCFSSTGQSVTSRVGGGDVPKFIEMIELFKLAADAANVSE